MKPRDSPVADDTFGGIEVFDAAGDSMGYISKNLDEGGYTITTDPTQAVSISFTQDGSNPFSITISSNDRQAGYPYLGATLNTGSDMGVSSAAFANLGGISHIISGPSESDDTGESNTRQLYAGSETAIFLYNADTNAITGQWTNTDNTKVDTIFYFGPKDSYSLGMIAPENYDQFAIDFPEDQQKVTFKYVSIDPTPGV
ncbi:uncharacterized protein I303_108317 [Kwoniella dejecticola CBS 10117]|uniref:Uncharacterized protein n=1 Tax=Kwoniella dejecticola CBS 10117 TaxID=1296121 RepID=A0A1A5ZXQ5_9TREE|nr:uncharacterized protein I303_07356 [Kwoniella dejecticola CBS 10117]OBR82594.1 hypothetical protein I303_07356 [Kwoniella dejecticola CBS 10117]